MASKLKPFAFLLTSSLNFSRSIKGEKRREKSREKKVRKQNYREFSYLHNRSFQKILKDLFSFNQSLFS